MATSTSGLKFCLSTNRQTQYNTALPDVNMTFNHLLENEAIFNHDDEKFTNAPEVGKGHKHPTEVKNMKTSTDISLNFRGSSHIIPWGCAFAMGEIVSSELAAGPPAVYQHEITVARVTDPAFGLQLPVTSVVQELAEGEQAKYRDILVKGFTLSGSTEEHAKFQADLIGSGFREASSITVPDPIATSFFVFNDFTFQYGTSNISADIQDFNLTYTNEIKEDKTSYGLGCPKMTIDDVFYYCRSRLLKTGETITLNFKLLMVNDLDTDSLKNTIKSLQITATGDSIDATYNHSFTIDFPKITLNAKKETGDGIYIYNCSPILLWDNTLEGLFKITVINDQPNYMLLPS